MQYRFTQTILHSQKVSETAYMGYTEIQSGMTMKRQSNTPLKNKGIVLSFVIASAKE